MRVGKTFRVEAEQGRLQHVSNLTKYEQYINVDDIEMDVFIFPISKMPNLDASKIMDWNLMFPPTESSSTDIPASLMQRETATQITPGPGFHETTPVTAQAESPAPAEKATTIQVEPKRKM